MTPLQFTRNVRSLNRIRRIAQVLTRHGFGHFVQRVQLGRFVPVWMLRQWSRPKAIPGSPLSVGRRLAIVCAELGPTFIKLAQMLCTRPDIVPHDVLVELRSLQDEVPPFDTSVARETIVRRLGRPIEECFEWFDDVPLASGSIAQVHRARSNDGRDLVVKVRRPDIQDIIRDDMQLLHWIAETIESVIPELRPYRPQELINELDEMLKRELDFIHEASTTARFSLAFAADPDIRIPPVFWDLTAPHVLTLGVIHGHNVETLLNDDFLKEALDRKLLARRLSECFLTQIFELGVFHTDPHPGNVLVEAPAQIGLIDFGQVGTITDEMLTQLVVIVYAAVHKEVDVIVDGLADLCAIETETHRRDLTRAMQILQDKYYGLPLKRFDLGTLVNEFLDVVRRHDLMLPREILALLKCVGLVGAIAAQLDPDQNILELLEPRIRKVIAERLSPGRFAKGTALWSWQMLNVVRHAPGQLRDVLRRAASGEWRLQLRHENLDKLTMELDRSSNRLSFAIVIAGIIVGSSVVVSAGGEITVPFMHVSIQTLGLVGFLVAGFLGLGLSWAIFRSGRLH